MTQDERERLHRVLDGLPDDRIQDASWLLGVMAEPGPSLAAAQDRPTRWYLLLATLVETAPPAWVEDDQRRVRMATSLPYANSEAFNQDHRGGTSG